MLSLVLNSGVCHYFVESTAKAIDGGFFAYQKTQLAPFGIPHLTPNDVAHIAALPAADQDDVLADRYGIVLPTHYRRIDHKEPASLVHPAHTSLPLVA